MSLQHAAKHLEKHGRNGDTVLVHMSKGEVKSLNDLAMAGGGHLTINPHTGLPEAGFLQRMLPMIIGAGLTATGVGSPLGVSMMVGAGYTAATGSLKQGLMAGLGAYGGAGIGNALASSGTAATQAAAPAASLGEAAAATPAAPVLPPSGSPLAGAGYTPSPAAVAAQPVTAPVSVDPLTNAPLNAAPQPVAPSSVMDNFKTTGNKMIEGFKSLGTEGGPTKFYENLATDPGTYGAKTTLAAAAAPLVDEALKPEAQVETPVDSDPGQQFDYMANPVNSTQPVNPYGSEARYFNPQYVKRKTTRFADGGKASEAQSAENPALKVFKQMQAQRATQAPQAPQVDANAQYADYLRQTTNNLAQPQQRAPAISANSGYSGYNPATQRYGEMQGSAAGMPMRGRSGGSGLSDADMESFGNAALSTTNKIGSDINQLRFATGGGISHLGDYSDGGRLLRGPGDGVSDSIPAVIGKKQPARLADGEFVVPARIVSELGNGSTEAGARKLYAMMDRIQKARGKTVGKGKVAKNSRSEKHLPA